MLGGQKGTLVARLSPNTQSQVKVDDGYLIALAKQGDHTSYDRLVRRYYGFVRLKASSYFLAGGDSDDLIQEGLVGLYKAVRDYRQVDFAGSAVLVLGAEGKGLRPRVASSCDELVSLPVRGRIASLNVSAAAAALLYGILQEKTRP